MDPATVNLDGSTLEGGGQLLRIAVGLSALLSRPISIHNIRANRTPPGLKYQHAAGLRLVASICSARLDGCETGSSTITFTPQALPATARAQEYTADPGTAGSIALLLQVSLPCLVFAPSPSPSLSPVRPTITSLTLRGGTNATHAPQIDYTQHVFLPFLQKYFGLAPTLEIVKRGYYPKGGGEVRVSIPSVHGPLPAVTLTARGQVIAVRGRAYVAGLPRGLADAMCAAATAVLADAGLGVAEGQVAIASVRERPADAVGSGSGIVLWAETEDECVFGGSALGRKGVDPARVGREAAGELVRNLAHGGCVDEYMQDQMIIFLALAAGHCTVKTGPLTLHTRTAIWVAEQLTEAKFRVEETQNGAVIECDGIGYVPPSSATAACS